MVGADADLMKKIGVGAVVDCIGVKSAKGIRREIIVEGRNIGQILIWLGHEFETCIAEMNSLHVRRNTSCKKQSWV